MVPREMREGGITGSEAMAEEIGPAADRSAPALRVEIGGGTRGGGCCPARRAARNGDTSGVATEEEVEAAAIEANTGDVAAAATEAEAAEDIFDLT